MSLGGLIGSSDPFGARLDTAAGATAPLITVGPLQLIYGVKQKCNPHSFPVRHPPGTSGSRNAACRGRQGWRMSVLRKERAARKPKRRADHAGRCRHAGAATGHVRGRGKSNGREEAMGFAGMPPFLWRDKIHARCTWRNEALGLRRCNFSGGSACLGGLGGVGGVFPYRGLRARVRIHIRDQPPPRGAASRPSLAGRRGIRAVAVHKMSTAAPHWRRIP